jgi:hypothetical protein
MGWGNETYDDATDRPKFNTKNPLRRDTSTVPGGGWTVFRYKGKDRSAKFFIIIFFFISIYSLPHHSAADNTGMWALHCHIEVTRVNDIHCIFHFYVTSNQLMSMFCSGMLKPVFWCSSPTSLGRSLN